MKGTNDDRPFLFDLLFGRHSYSMSPEDETWWCRAMVALGFLLGMWTFMILFSMIA